MPLPPVIVKVVGEMVALPLVAQVDDILTVTGFVLLAPVKLMVISDVS